MKTQYKLKVRTFRKLPNPYEEYTNGKRNPELYEILIDIQDLPNDLNMDTNPRFQNMRTSVVKKIKDSLLVDDRCFFIKNRGILLSVKDIKFNNITNEIIINLDDASVHGCVDGGHTFRAIQLIRESIKHKHFVRLEIMTGIEDTFESVAAARNTSATVPDSAIAELRNNFKFIKDFLVAEPFADSIAYKENDDEREIDISYVISMLFMFNLNRLSSKDSAPVQACSGVQSCMKDFLNTYKEHENNITNNPYYKQKNIIVDLFKLHDMLQKNIGIYYQQYFSNGRYGQVKGVTATNTKTTFYKESSDYLSPKGFIFPILGSFRALLVEKNGFYEWVRDPFDYLDKIGKELVGETIERHRSLGNAPGNVGKDSNHWKQLYRRVLTEHLLEQQLEM